MPAGKYTLKVQLMGYASQTKTVVVSNEYTVDLHFVMEKEDIMMDAGSPAGSIRLRDRSQ